ncbi:hypothetical protein P872_13690 [Rhodonellum psychrophilum GCM71 = DSM 17998]|uniref:Uncharacterized protein n=1 Tax=Rhodonellum psychrophilum GCM71 = DSM 17998 TaxID=1123057 RepID=U5BS74_9BACT|nr:hypothetical protein P872_13690 [Rhodonellum psychrophilum GCM71 = DSM 17998]
MPDGGFFWLFEDHPCRKFTVLSGALKFMEGEIERYFSHKTPSSVFPPYFQLPHF